MHVEKNRTIALQGTTDYDLYLIFDGIFESRLNDLRTLDFKNGDVYGSLEAIRSSKERAISLVSKTPGTILLINRSFVHHLTIRIKQHSINT